MKVYLCGPINGCTEEECKDWREYAKTKLPDTLDPMRRDYRGKEDESVDEIVKLDYVDVANSDIILVNAPSPSWGTAMEIHEAFGLRKLIVVVVPERSRISPWLRYHTHKISHSFDDAIAWIQSCA